MKGKERTKKKRKGEERSRKERRDDEQKSTSRDSVKIGDGKRGKEKE